MRRTWKIVAVTALMLLLFAIGCDRAPELQSVSEAGGLFHVRVPSEWQSNAQPQALILFGDDTLPTSEDEAFEQLSVAMFVASAAGTEPVGPKLTALVNARATGRAWKRKTVGAPRSVSIGGRPGYQLDVSGVDEKGREFAGRAALVRTAGSEVLVFAVAPETRWDARSTEVDSVFKEWYWHSGSVATSTPAPKSP